MGTPPSAAVPYAATIGVVASTLQLVSDGATHLGVASDHVIESFRNQDAKAVYRRLREHGRMMPDGLTFVSSWVAADPDRCFQLMETDDVTLLQRWVAAWSDLMAFEIVAVVPGKETAQALGAQPET